VGDGGGSHVALASSANLSRRPRVGREFLRRSRHEACSRWWSDRWWAARSSRHLSRYWRAWRRRQSRTPDWLALSRRGPLAWRSILLRRGCPRCSTGRAAAL